MRHYLTFLLILNFLHGFSQEVSDKTKQKSHKIGIFLHTNINYSSSDFVTNHSLALFPEREYFSFGGLSVEYITVKKRFLHEIQWIPIYISAYKQQIITNMNYVTENKVLYLKTFANYFWDFLILDKSVKWNPFVGGSIGVRYEYIDAIPLTSTSFREKNSRTTILMNLVPGIVHNLNQSSAFMFKLSIPINEFLIEYEKVENPALPVKLRSRTNRYAILLPKDLYFQFGLMFKI